MLLYFFIVVGHWNITIANFFIWELYYKVDVHLCSSWKRNQLLRKKCGQSWVFLYDVHKIKFGTTLRIRGIYTNKSKQKWRGDVQKWNVGEVLKKEWEEIRIFLQGKFIFIFEIIYKKSIHFGMTAGTFKETVSKRFNLFYFSCVTILKENWVYFFLLVMNLPPSFLQIFSYYRSFILHKS